MKVRIALGVILREERGFGGICYVPHRSDFFALDNPVYSFVSSFSDSFSEIPKDKISAATRLASLGIVETSSPKIEEVAYSGVSFIGNFIDIPCLENPLVVNCFSTSLCPLRCIYCHADDLMQEYRASELESDNRIDTIDIGRAISTAKKIKPIVTVITGGEPLIRPERTIRTIEALALVNSLVLDTSGVGFFSKLIPTLKAFNVHVRLSLDNFSKDNDDWRPINPKYKSEVEYLSSRLSVFHAIEDCLCENIGFSVQTVVHSKNEDIDNLFKMREFLLKVGVKNWIIHLAIKGGLARKKEMAAKGNRGHILPRFDVRNDIWRLIENTIIGNYPLDIRCTDTDSTPNSVLLINSRGELFTEGFAHHGKVNLSNNDDCFKNPDAFSYYIDRFGHARRYLNWNPWYYKGQKSLRDICYKIFE